MLPINKMLPVFSSFIRNMKGWSATKDGLEGTPEVGTTTAVTAASSPLLFYKQSGGGDHVIFFHTLANSSDNQVTINC